ncbi:hypothetical protein [Spirillospora sp. CA-294931]|uniref:hypothetical protein n=1 Tax=Spirillospora sp. CA-294931 TaxID=3240042 RepID=UPI003D8E02BA
MPIDSTRLAVLLFDKLHPRYGYEPLAPPPSPPSVQVPNPPPQAPPGLDAKMQVLLGWGKYGVLVCGVAGLFFCAGQMVIGRKNRSSFAADGATGVPWVLGGLSLAATAAPIVGVFFR